MNRTLLPSVQARDENSQKHERDLSAVVIHVNSALQVGHSFAFFCFSTIMGKMHHHCHASSVN